MHFYIGGSQFYLIGCYHKHVIYSFEYRILSSIVRTFYMQNDAEIFPAHYTWKVTEKGFKMACMMNKLAMINSCEIILEK